MVNPFEPLLKGLFPFPLIISFVLRSSQPPDFPSTKVKMNQRAIFGRKEGVRAA
jgi:hypothetical protein